MDKFIDKSTFLAALHDGQSIMVGGFMAVGTPEMFIDWIVESNVKDLTIICNDAGFEHRGVGKLIANNQVKKLIASHIGLNPDAGKKMSQGALTIELVPQGTLAEQIRAHGAGLGGILTPTGIKTIVEENKQKIIVNDQAYLLEVALGADLALIEARTSDAYGNLVYDKTARNFNPIMATAAKHVFAYVHHVVKQLDPEIVVTPHIFIDGIVQKEANHD